MALSERLKENREALFAYPIATSIFAGVLILFIGIWIGANVFASDSGYSVNLYTEFMGVLVTVGIIDVIYRGRDRAEKAREKTHEQEEKIEELKARLVREAGSRDNGTALNAIREAEEHSYLKGNNGILKSADLYRANLAGVDLWEANLVDTNLNYANFEGAKLLETNLKGAELREANLAGTYLHDANFEDAYLVETNLADAHLYGANLQGACLRKANLQGAILAKANLQGADLMGANLKGANLVGAAFDEKTVLPDLAPFSGYYMTRYTDPYHPDFWQPDWARTGFNTHRDWVKAGKPDQSNTD